MSNKRTPEAIDRRRELHRLHYGPLWRKRKWEEVQARLNAIKLERGCADCGYRAHPAALQFDHLPGHPKVANISAMTRGSWESIEAEIAKCEVVCANCHAIRTVMRRQDEEKRLSTAS